MRLALALTEEDPEGKGTEGEDPMREVGAVIEKGLCSSRSTKGFCLQSRLSHFDKCQLKKEARRKEEGMGGYVFQDLTVQAVQNLTKRIVRVVEKKWLF